MKVSVDAGDIAGGLAAVLLPGQRPTVATFTGDAATPVGTYKRPGRGRDMVVQVTQAPQGIAVSVNGMTFRLGSNFLIFRDGDLHLSGGSAYSVLKRQ